MTRSGQDLQFAQRMHALKVRTNRSYEALAHRVGVSSSTLHRYCRGGTVPADYEVVARFVRVCGASRAEAEELLLSWALAVHGERPATTRRVWPLAAVVGLVAAAVWRLRPTRR